MIIDTPPSPSKNPLDLPQAQNAQELAQPPPAYPGHNNSLPQQGQGYRPASDLEAGSSRPLPRDPQRSPLLEHVDAFIESTTREPARKRFITAFAYAALIWLLTFMLTRSIIELSWNNGTKRSGRQWGFELPGWDWGWSDRDEGSIARPQPGEGSIERCVTGASQWLQGPYHDDPRTAFDLPLSANALYMFSRGHAASGTVSFEMFGADSNLPQDAIYVQVIAKGSRKALDVTSVCTLKRAQGEYGIGFLTPDKRTGSKIDFEIHVFFPARLAYSSTPLKIKSFESNLARFHHSFGDLSNVYFESLQVNTYRPITTNYLNATSVSLRTADWPITGHFEVSTSLELMTTNAPIQSNITIYDNSAQDKLVLMQTTNAPIVSSLDLLSIAPPADGRRGSDKDGWRHVQTTARAPAGGHYTIIAYTTNAPLSVSALGAPIQSALEFSLHTSNGPATLEVPSTFEGSFNLTTKNDLSDVRYNEETKDPEGLGRRRIVGYVMTDTYALGNTYWDSPKDMNPRSHAEIRSTNAPVTLSIL